MAGSSAFPNDTDEVEKIIRDEGGDDIIKSIRDVPSKSMPTVSLKDPYIDYILSWLESRVDINKSLNVIVDPMHGGAAVGYTSKILESLGMRVKEIHGFHDSSFGA